ncbi:MAG TPA: hypothetical protein VK324_14095, partial [Tepidisphaeraceae bacterium]|nr:hypothetical protein [Tepidisphaeraceae bacterium]
YAGEGGFDIGPAAPRSSARPVMADGPGLPPVTLADPGVAGGATWAGGVGDGYLASPLGGGDDTLLPPMPAGDFAALSQGQGDAPPMFGVPPTYSDRRLYDNGAPATSVPVYGPPVGALGPPVPADPPRAQYYSRLTIEQQRAAGFAENDIRARVGWGPYARSHGDELRDQGLDPSRTVGTPVTLPNGARVTVYSDGGRSVVAMEEVGLAKTQWQRFFSGLSDGSMKPHGVTYFNSPEALQRRFDNLNMVTTSAMAALTVAGAAPVFTNGLSQGVAKVTAPGTAAYPVQVTSWADKGLTPDLNNGRYVMLGGPTKSNYVRTFLWGPKGELVPPSFQMSRGDPRNYITGNVPRANLVWPQRTADFWKAPLFGQRQIDKP